MWLSMVILGMIFMTFGFFLNEIIRIVMIELRAARKGFNHEK